MIVVERSAPRNSSRKLKLESEVPMNFIETIFGVSPDLGSGALEAAILLVALAIPIAIAVLRTNLRRHNDRTS